MILLVVKGMILVIFMMIWLIVLYIVGALAKRIKLFEKSKTSTLLIMLIASVFVNLAVLVATGIFRQINFVSPTVLFFALILVVIFSRIKLSSRAVSIIKRTSRWAFGIYLFHIRHFYHKLA